jgi:uncharacterized RDD family membrane protein YckC
MNKLTFGTRFGSMILDHFIMTMIIMVIVAPGMIYDMLQSFENSSGEPKLFFGNIYLSVFAFSIYFNKDIFGGRSPAKRILKLQVIDIKTNRPASPLKCLARNATIILWPIEVIVALFNRERRIGDLIAGTKLTIANPEESKENRDWKSIAIAVLISALATYVILVLPFQLLVSGMM